MTKLYHVGISGGKDSTALLLWMVYESGLLPEQIRATFANTHNEADETYDHIRMLDFKVHPIEWIEPPLGFYDLARKKKRFPSTKARFCTTELKMKPTKDHIDGLLREGFEIVHCSGVRAEESAARAKLSEWGNPLESYFGLAEWRPILHWKIEDVFLIHKRYGVPLNPLYAKGAKRVGCLPCIMSRKSEMRMIAREFPELIDKLRREEQSVNSCSTGSSTFFPINSIPEVMRSKMITTKDGRELKVPTIDDVIAWTRTKDKKKHNRQFALGFWHDESLNEADVHVCPSTMGACE